MKEVDSSPVSQPGRWRRIIGGLIPWVVSAGIIAYVVANEDMGEVVDAFGKASLPIYLAVLIPFLLVLLLLESIYLYLGFQWFANVGRFGELLRARAATYLLTIVSIFIGLGGLVMYGRRRYGISYTLGTSVMLNELLHELASQCTLALMVGLLLPVALVPDSALNQVRGVTLVGMIGVGFYLLCVVLSRVSLLFPERIPAIKVFEPFVTISLWQYGAYYLIKLLQNLIYGFFLAGTLFAFGLKLPLIASLGFMQIIHLTRAIPISAFGIGVDQIAFPVFFGPWEPADSPGLVLAVSLAFTFSMIAGRALLGVPFVRGVFQDMLEESSPQPRLRGM